MCICYLCGEKMVDRNEYQGNKDKFSSKPKFIHAEHVIQDALYGRLKSSTILCESCGSQLSTEVDANFCKIFQSISEQFSEILAPTEKNKNYQPSLKGMVKLKNGQTIPVYIKGGVIYPIKPFYEMPLNGEVKVYGEKKSAKNYLNLVKKELLQADYDVENLKYTIISELQDHIELGINFSEGIDDFNHKFKMGFIKIATGFAIMNGIDRAEVPNTIDTVNNKLKYTPHIVPYAPCEVFEMIYDQQRIALEPEYPNHTLILYVDDFGEYKKLVCYIDLFSTFAYYVVLNDNYNGKDVHAVFQQSITKLEKPEINIMHQRPKRLLIIEQFLDIKPEEIQGLDLKDRYEYAQRKYNQYTVSYKLKLTDTINSIAEKIALNIAAKKGKLLDLLSEIEREMIENLPDLDSEDLILIREEYQRLKDENPEKIYRQSHLTVGGKGDFIIKSNLYSLIDRMHRDMDGIRQYTHAKFHMLSYFIHNLKIKNN